MKQLENFEKFNVKFFDLITFDLIWFDFEKIGGEIACEIFWSDPSLRKLEKLNAKILPKISDLIPQPEEIGKFKFEIFWSDQNLRNMEKLNVKIFVQICENLKFNFKIFVLILRNLEKMVVNFQIWPQSDKIQNIECENIGSDFKKIGKFGKI